MNHPAAERESSARPGAQAATPERFWRFAQRYISFEEPGNRWQRLEQTLRSQLNRSDPHYRNFDALAGCGKVEMLHAAFGNAAIDVAELLLTAVLALEDLAMFAPVTFESWHQQLVPPSNSESSQSLEIQLFNSDRPPGLRGNAGALDGPQKLDQMSYKLYRWAIETGYSTAQALWLSVAVWMRPAWSLLRTDGEWTNDTRACFLLRFMDRARELGRTPSIELLTRARALFQSMVCEFRAELPGSFLPNLVLLVEGPTEAMLIPFFAKCMHTDLDASGVAVIAAGGANQVVRRFLELRDTVELPVVIVLDADAGTHASTVEDMLREQDRLHVLSAGEIEDVFEIDLFVQLVNEHLAQSRLVNPVSLSDFSGRERRTAVLDRLWKQRGLGRFDKIGFAGTVVNSSVFDGSVPADVIRITQSVQQLLGDRLGRRDNR